MADKETPYGVWKEFNNYEFRPDEIMGTHCAACDEPAEGVGRVFEKEKGFPNGIETVEYFCRDCCYLLMHVRHTHTTERTKKDRKIFWLRHHMTADLPEVSKNKKKAIEAFNK